jgi:hypothetical protein
MSRADSARAELVHDDFLRPLDGPERKFAAAVDFDVFHGGSRCRDAAFHLRSAPSHCRSGMQLLLPAAQAGIGCSIVDPVGSAQHFHTALLHLVFKFAARERVDVPHIA